MTMFVNSDTDASERSTTDTPGNRAVRPRPAKYLLAQGIFALGSREFRRARHKCHRFILVPSFLLGAEMKTK